MKRTDKKCVFIIPYYGNFNNYFSLFLKSCSKNPSYDWIIFTDNKRDSSYPDNVKIINLSFSEINKLACDKFGFDVCLNTPYKFCDFKPAYGFLFEEYISEYEYWGHCDCDVVFGDLERMLTPLLEEDYDKLFAAGHLTIYKNNPENNRRFMKPYNNRLLYKEAYTTDKIFTFDEDYNGNDNVHSIFLQDGAKVYQEDMSMNPSIHHGKFVRAYYDEKVHNYVKEEYKKARYYWDNGKILRVYLNGNTLEKTEFLYIHLQMRKMRNKIKSMDSVIEILPDRFINVTGLPKSKKEFRSYSASFPYFYWVDVYKKKIRRKIKEIFNK